MSDVQEDEGINRHQWGVAVGILVVDLVIGVLARALWPRAACRWGLKASVVLAGVEVLRFTAPSFADACGGPDSSCALRSDELWATADGCSAGRSDSGWLERRPSRSAILGVPNDKENPCAAGPGEIHEQPAHERQRARGLADGRFDAFHHCGGGGSEAVEWRAICTSEWLAI